MKEFIKDYKGLCNQHMEFHKKHWKAEVLVNVVTIGVIFVGPMIINHIEEIKKNSGKKKESCN